jgi:hypothetical protein
MTSALSANIILAGAVRGRYYRHPALDDLEAHRRHCQPFRFPPVPGLAASSPLGAPPFDCGLATAGNQLGIRRGRLSVTTATGSSTSTSASVIAIASLAAADPNRRAWPEA